MAFFARLSLALGPCVGRFLLGPICAYFFLAHGAERKASRDYLRRVLPHEPRWVDVWKQFWVFSSATLDRLFILGAGGRGVDVELTGADVLHRHLDAGRGCFLLGAHLGSFEVARAARHRRADLPLRFVQDRGQSPAATALLEALDPNLTREVLDLSGAPGAVGLQLAETLRGGALIAMLADRVRGREASVRVRFLGGEAEFPVAPWRFAMVLGAPVVLFWGLRTGSGRYRVIFETFDVPAGVPRAERAAAVRDCVQRYADRLAEQARSAPYNWFNFYDFWVNGK